MAVRMAKSEPGSKKVTFTVSQEFVGDGTCSVVGDFNEWTPGSHKLVKRSAGKYSVSVVLPHGEYEYRFLSDPGQWLTDPDAEQAGVNNLVLVS